MKQEVKYFRQGTCKDRGGKTRILCLIKVRSVERSGNGRIINSTPWTYYGEGTDGLPNPNSTKTFRGKGKARKAWALFKKRE